VQPAGTIVVVSPHSDDGVLSVGAAMAGWARGGARVELLTVLALDPDSATPTEGWDRRAGFATEGEAGRARREEDRRACALIGVTPRWLPYGSSDFDRHGDDEQIWEAVDGIVGQAEVVLVPGSPLTHPDHAWLSSLLTARLPPELVALYAEQPYTARAGGTPFARAPARTHDRLVKWRAIRAYRSQLPLLGMTQGLRRGPLRLALADERVAWPRQ